MSAISFILFQKPPTKAATRNDWRQSKQLNRNASGSSKNGSESIDNKTLYKRRKWQQGVSIFVAEYIKLNWCCIVPLLWTSPKTPWAESLGPGSVTLIIRTAQTIRSLTHLATLHNQSPDNIACLCFGFMITSCAWAETVLLGKVEASLSRRDWCRTGSLVPFHVPIHHFPRPGPS